MGPSRRASSSKRVLQIANASSVAGRLSTSRRCAGVSSHSNRNRRSQSPSAPSIDVIARERQDNGGRDAALATFLMEQDVATARAAGETAGDAAGLLAIQLGADGRT